MQKKIKTDHNLPKLRVRREYGADLQTTPILGEISFFNILGESFVFNILGVVYCFSILGEYFFLSIS